ncbi:MAG: hypothetical protein ABW046_05545 [Actinoplanes sp.]
MNPFMSTWQGERAAAGEGKHRGHPPTWWAQFAEASEKFDAATVTEGLADVITPAISSPLLRREAEIAAEVVVRALNKPSSPELAERAAKARERLAATVERLAERATAEDAGISEAYALCHILEGRFAEGAAEIETSIGTGKLLDAFVAALYLEHFDKALTMRLLKAGQRPDQAVQSGLVVGKYGWWPTWLLKVVAERALDGTLDEETITALDRCAYAELSPAQARVARRLLTGDEMLIDASADRLENMGEPDAAVKLREGDLTTVALAARLIPI